MLKFVIILGAVLFGSVARVIEKSPSEQVVSAKHRSVLQQIADSTHDIYNIRQQIEEVAKEVSEKETRSSTEVWQKYRTTTEELNRITDIRTDDNDTLKCIEPIISLGKDTKTIISNTIECFDNELKYGNEHIVVSSRMLNKVLDKLLKIDKKLNTCISNINVGNDYYRTEDCVKRVCDLSLLSTSHLKRHMRVHTGEKPYSCDLCGKSFAERYNLFAHQKIHDPAEIMAKAAKKITYKCEQCKQFFDKKQKLDEHTKERHGSATNERKWIGHTVDVENSNKLSEILVDQSWQDNDYSKLQSPVVGMKTAQTDNTLSQISHESIAMLMSQTNYNKSVTLVIQPTNSITNAEIDQTQM